MLWVFLQVKMQSSLHSRKSIKNEAGHVAMHYCPREMKISLSCDFTQNSQWNLLTDLVHPNRKVRDSAQGWLSLDPTW